MIGLIGGFESTYLPAHNVDVAELTGHIDRFATDIRLLRDCGVERIRYPIRWPRIEPEPGEFIWESTDAVLRALREAGLEVTVDLLHHTSYPRWLTLGFADARFGPAYLRYLEAFACRYQDTAAYILFNEPFATLYLCGHEAIWPPYWRGTEGLARILANVLPAIGAAARMYRDLLPAASHVYHETCERHSTGAVGLGATEYTALANDRRFVVLDALLGRPLDNARPFVAALAAIDDGRCLDALRNLRPLRADILGLDYYAHNQWHFQPGSGTAPSPKPWPLSELIQEYWDRYRVPCVLGETNIRGYPSDRASWLKYTLDQCEQAVAACVPLSGYCWFPFTDSCDWDSMLREPARRIDPVGVYWLDAAGRPRESSMSVAYRAAAAGAPAAALPAYRLRQPVARWLRGFLPHMDHWDWILPPADESGRNPPPVGSITHLPTEKLASEIPSVSRQREGAR